MDEDGITITEDGVTFSPPTASATAKALDPRGPAAGDSADRPTAIDAAPLYVVVMHEGLEVLYKKVEG